MKARIIPPEDEMVLTFARSGGPGGQNVNKRDTKAIVHWHVGASRVFSDEEKARIRFVLAGRINNEDHLVVSASRHRTQERNKAAAIRLLRSIVAASLLFREERVPTKPTRASKIKRMEDKQRVARKKRERSGIPD